jgi:hypothetical protein
MVKLLERSSRLPGSEKSGIDDALMLVNTPVRLGVGIPGMEKTLVGMIDCKSSFVAAVAIIGVDEVEEEVMIPPPECRTG